MKPFKCEVRADTEHGGADFLVLKIIARGAHIEWLSGPEDPDRRCRVTVVVDTPSAESLNFGLVRGLP